MRNRLSSAIFGILLCATMLSTSKVAAQAEHSLYHIDGSYKMIYDEASQSYRYHLTDITDTGVVIQYTDGINRLEGKVDPESESIEFIFDTIHSNVGYKNIRFWKWQPDNNDRYYWQEDAEVRQPVNQRRRDMAQVVILVMDCSESMRKSGNFKPMKKMVEEVVNRYASAVSGNIHLGIVAFSTVQEARNNIYPITPLTPEVAKDIKDNFLKNLNTYNNTALYFAMDTASILVDNYIKNLQLPENIKFSGAMMTCFTDGFDNHSILKGHVYKHGLENPYLIHLEGNVVKGHRLTYTHANGKKDCHDLQVYTIAYQDEDADVSSNIFMAVNRKLNSDGKPRVAKNFGEVNDMFQSIARDLVERFQQLRCFVPRAFEGRVRWTFDNSNINPRGFFGFSVGANAEFNLPTSVANPYFGFGGGVGIDFAFPRRDFSADGGFLNFKYTFSTSDPAIHFSFGYQHLGKRHQFERKLLWGVGLDVRSSLGSEFNIKNKSLNSQRTQYSKSYDCADEMGVGAVFRLGSIGPKHLYYYFDLTAGVYRMGRYTETYQWNTRHGGYWSCINETSKSMTALYFNLSFNLGYKF